MTEIHLNLNNFSDSGLFLNIFPESNKYEFTSKKVFKLKQNVICKNGHEMVHNGYDYLRKKGLGKVKIGEKELYLKCRKQQGCYWRNLE